MPLLEPLDKVGLLETLSESLTSESLQVRSVSDWLVFGRTGFDQILEESEEPFQIFEFLLHLTSRKYLARVWHTTVWRGTLLTPSELPQLLSEAFQRTVPCSGLAQLGPSKYTSVHELPFKRICAQDCHLSVKIAHWDERKENKSPVSCIKCSNVSQMAVAQKARKKRKRRLRNEEEDEEYIPTKKRSYRVSTKSPVPESYLKVEMEEEEKKEEVKEEKKEEEEEEDAEDFDWEDQNQEDEDEEFDYNDDKHAKPSTSGEKFECKFCPKTFFSESHLLQHEVYDEFRLKGNRHCVFCAVPYETAPSLHAHAMEAHKKYSAMPCPACQVDCPLDDTFMDHFKQCIAPPDSNRPSRQPAYVRPKVSEGRKCYDCGKIHKDWAALRTHYLWHTGVRHLKCPEPDCSYETHSDQSLFNHQKIHRRQRGEKKHVCDQCGLDFCANQSLQFHIKYMHKMESDDITCDQCGKFFSLRRSYIRHYRKEHSKDPQYSCRICGKRRDTTSKARQCEDGHNGICKFTCTICGKGIRTKKGMEDHMRVHSGERPFPCKHCDYTAKSSSGLYIHVRALHKKEKEEEEAQRKKKKEALMEARRLANLAKNNV